jgi:hypothetical protein
MPKGISIALGVVMLMFSVCGALLLLVHSEPSTAALDADLAEVRAQIRAANSEDLNYLGGVLKALMSLRREIWRTTEAMLAEKRASFLRRIELNYVANGKQIVPAADERLKEILADLDGANASLSKHLAEAERYSGGLIQAMLLMTVATDRLTLAQLSLAYYQAKYGIAPMVEIPRVGLSVPTDLGNVVKDKDAL